jgi:hypothetical protein
VASRKHPGVFWTHNDGGGAKRQVLYAITREGRNLGAFPLTDVLLNDWEDIAIDADGHLFIGDIGNNEFRRRELAVHEIDEPDPKGGTGALHLNARGGWRSRASRSIAKVSSSGRSTATSSPKSPRTSARKSFVSR